MKLWEEARQNKVSYEPYKYVMTDAQSICLGAKLSYGELLEGENTPFKLKAIISQYILKESDPENTLESEFYYLKEEGFVYGTYEQLKTRLKVMVREEKRSLFGRTVTKYREKICPLKELVRIDPKEKEGMGMVITEVILSKLQLMSFTV